MDRGPSRGCRPYAGAWSSQDRGSGNPGNGAGQRSHHQGPAFWPVEAWFPMFGKDHRLAASVTSPTCLLRSPVVYSRMNNLRSDVRNIWIIQICKKTPCDAGVGLDLRLKLIELPI